MKRYRIFFYAILLGLSLSVSAQTTVGPARAKLNAFAQGLHSLTGHFTQTLSSANGQAGKPSDGTLVLQAPRQFRWDTVSPYKQTIVADGSRVWNYDPQLEQVTVTKQNSEESHSPLTVLTNLKQMDQDFKITEQGEHDGLVWLRLKSAGADAQFDYADLGFDANGLARMTLHDQLGSTTDIRFSDWQRNAEIPPQDFNFTPPKGADVIGDLPVMTTQPLND